MINLKQHVGKSFTIYGLEIQTGAPHGTVAKLLWVNDTHVCLITKSGVLLCMRVYLADQSLTLK